MSSIIDDLKARFAKFGAEFHDALDKLRGDEKQLATEAKADVTKVETDVRPAMQEAQADAEKLAGEAVTDIKQATQPVANPEPPTAA
jgi:glutamine synthetase type III